MTVDAVRAGYPVAEYEIDLEHRAAPAATPRASSTAPSSSSISPWAFVTRLIGS